MDIDNFYLFEKINKTKWEVLLSTGMSTVNEIKKLITFYLNTIK